MPLIALVTLAVGFFTFWASSQAATVQSILASMI